MRRGTKSATQNKHKLLLFRFGRTWREKEHSLKGVAIHPSQFQVAVDVLLRNL